VPGLCGAVEQPDARRGHGLPSAPPEAVLEEAAEDFGERRALAFQFDEILAGAKALILQRSMQNPENALSNLADALSEDIAGTPEEGLLREAAEDFGDRRALAIEFERAVRQMPLCPTRQELSPPNPRRSVVQYLRP
jgi:hypothetical protein